MSLTERSSHFEFGENWRDYAKSIDRQRISAAIEGVRKLFPEGLDGKTFLDIGCGSGLHSLAAFELGAKSVLAVDIDENSVAATRGTLSRYASGKPWDTKVASVFDATPESLGTFDVVYSWGVLHHTGDMWRSVECASALVNASGQLAIALYTKTPTCNFWRKEKAFYSKSPKIIQGLIRTVYVGAFLSFLPATNYKPFRFIRNYKKVRGMNFSHDAHDWLGGYPYESASTEEVHDRLERLGLLKIRTFEAPPSKRFAWSAGCSEYVYARPDMA